MKISRFLIAACASGAFALQGLADEEVPDHKLSEWRLGNAIGDKEVDLKKLDGKVVAIEYWGTR